MLPFTKRPLNLQVLPPWPELLLSGLLLCGVLPCGVLLVTPGEVAGRQGTPRAPSVSPTDPGAWNSDVALALLARGQAARLEEVNLGMLQSYEALTEGHIYFYVDTDEGEQALIRVDQVAVELFWQAPDQIRQRIVGERSETRLPVRDFRYYLDRLTLVQYGFEDEIQVGQGMDVAGVPHPLAQPPGRDPTHYPYDVQLGDAVVLRLPGEPEPLAVRELRVRPRDPSLPGFVGSVFLSERDAQIVRMTFTFTPASYVDRRTDWIRVSLDYGLWEGRYWLPNRQELEVRREVPELDLGVGTVIRAVLRVGDYELNVPIPEHVLSAPPVTQFPRTLRETFAFREGLYDAMVRDGVAQVEVQVDPRRIREEATRLLANQPPTGLAPFRLHVPAFSSLVRADPYRGVSVGAGASWRPAGTLRLRTRLGASLQTGRPEGLATLDGLRLDGHAVSVEAMVRGSKDRSARPVGPGLLSTLGTITHGQSYRSPWERSGIRATAETRPRPGTTITLSSGWARHRSERLIWDASPLGNDRSMAPLPPRITEDNFLEIGVRVDTRPTLPVQLPGTLSLAVESEGLLGPNGGAARLEAGIDFRGRASDLRQDFRAGLRGGATVGPELPQLARVLGGPGTLAGLPFAERESSNWGVGVAEASREVLTPWIRLRGALEAGWADDGLGLGTGVRGGVGLFYDILRIEGARMISGHGTHHGWRLVVGVDPLWWPYL